MDYKQFFREKLTKNVYGIYSSILEVYRQQMELLKTPTLFRHWLAGELEVPIETINLNSLNSALKRQRKKNKQAKQQQPASTSTQVNQSGNKTGGFQFSKPSSDDKKPSRIKEM